jgi:predicted Zn-dependent protease
VHRINTWVEEYNASIAVLNSDPDADLTETQFNQSIAHLNNAYSIQPDSLNTLEILGEVYLMKGDNDAALATFQRAIASEGEQTAYRYQRIGQLHIQNKSFDEAETILKTGISLFPASVELVQELADLYIQSNKSNQAIEVLGDLVDRDPDNAQYRLVYGIQIYSITQSHADDLRNTYTSIEDLNRTIREEERKSRPNRELLAQYRQTLSGFTADAVAAEAQIEDLTDRAEAQLKRSVELNDTNSFAFNALGTIYYNRGLAQFDKRNATNDNAAATTFDRAGRAFLEQSLPYNERAAELDGDNTDYWMFLFRVYTMLGMTEKALEAQQKAGL